MGNLGHNQTDSDKEVQNFQRKLQNLCSLAVESGNTLSNEQFRDAFGEEELDESQLIGIIQYLKAQGIHLLGDTFTVENDNIDQLPQTDAIAAVDVIDALFSQATLGQRVPLTAKEEAYLKEHLASLPKAGLSSAELSESFAALSGGDTSVRDQLIFAYMPEAARLAAEMNCSEILLQDLIGEADLLLITLLSQQEPAVKNDRWLRTSLRKGLLDIIDAESQQKASDQKLVERVQKLEDALLQLEEEDGTTNFTIEELTILLDMTEDELRDILRLTGEEA